MGTCLKQNLQWYAGIRPLYWYRNKTLSDRPLLLLGKVFEPMWLSNQISVFYAAIRPLYAQNRRLEGVLFQRITVSEVQNIARLSWASLVLAHSWRLWVKMSQFFISFFVWYESRQACRYKFHVTIVIKPNCSAKMGHTLLGFGTFLTSNEKSVRHNYVCPSLGWDRIELNCLKLRRTSSI